MGDGGSKKKLKKLGRPAELAPLYFFGETRFEVDRQTSRTLKGSEPDLLHPAHFPFAIPFFDGLPLVVRFFTLGEGDLQFGDASVGEVKAVGNDGHSFFLDAAFQFFEFAAVEENLAGATGFVVGVGPVLVFGDVHAFDIELAILKIAVGVAQVGIALANRFDLRSL